MKYDIIPIIILGRDRTMMTIENVKAVLKYVKYPKTRIIIGSDMSAPGHVQALRYFLNSAVQDFDILETSPDRHGLGNIMNMCFSKALEYSDAFVYIENDMILHRELDLSPYIDLMANTNIGAVNFKCSSQDNDKYQVKIFCYAGRKYAVPFPVSNDSHIATFGINMYSRKFIQQLGDVPDDSNTDEAETKFIRSYNRLFAVGKPFSMLAYDLENYHSMMNDKSGLFYHIGINCQHRQGVKWNPTIMPSYYHYLSDEALDEKYRKMFI